MSAPTMWWSETQGLIILERGDRYVRIMTADHTRTPGGRVFEQLPDDAAQIYALVPVKESDDVW